MPRIDQIRAYAKTDDFKRLFLLGCLWLFLTPVFFLDFNRAMEKSDDFYVNSLTAETAALGDQCEEKKCNAPDGPKMSRAEKDECLKSCMAFKAHLVNDYRKGTWNYYKGVSKNLRKHVTSQYILGFMSFAVPFLPFFLLIFHFLLRPAYQFFRKPL
ncbi:MAG: hypothetical protein EBQ96_02395 [Proteobacteria bacterium]|nr:hypothetical protein [Pseudomonadota bacterium]